MNDDFRCWYPLQIRFRDLDPLTHVNNAVYFVYYEEARSYYFNQLSPWLPEWPNKAEHQEGAQEEEADPANPRIDTGSRRIRYGLLVKEVTCTYELPLVHNDKAEVGVRVVRVGRTSFAMELQIRAMNEHERIFATGKSAMVWCNYQNGRPYPVPPTLRAAFEQMEGKAFPPPQS